MNAYEKGKMLKDTIEQLYVNEGRSKSYISDLLKIDRTTIRRLINEWGFQQNNQEKRKMNDFLKSNKEYIIARLKDGWTQRKIYTELKIGRLFFLKLVEYDKDILETIKLTSRISKNKYEEINDEIWKKILDYNYEVSNYGRIRSNQGILSLIPNVKNGYLYVSLTNKDGKRKTFRVHRLVAHAFCEGFSKEKNQVNHKDGDITNNKAENLEWVSATENLIHSYENLNRPHKGSGKIDYIIKYKNIYEFKTITAFAKFLDISCTQAKRYINEKEKYDITLIYKH